MKRARLEDGARLWCDAPLGVRPVWNEIQSYFDFAGANRVGPAETVFDVGANIGLFSLAAWRQSQGKARIFSFEPVPSTCAILAANARAFDPSGKSWKTLRAGLGARNEIAVLHHFPRLSVLSGRLRDTRRALDELDFALSSEQIGPPLELLNHLSPPLRRALGQRIGRFLLRTRPVAASMWTVSDAMRRLNLERIDCLKIDVEGAELDVLRGVELQDWPRIRRVMLEIETRAELDEAERILQSAGFWVETRDNAVFEGHDLKMMFGWR